MSNTQHPPLVFISHAADADGDIAKAFEDWIKLAYKSEVGTFVSSTLGIPPNTPPATAITTNLGKTTVLIALLSPIACGHDWLTHEMAKTEGRQRQVIPLLCKGARAKDVPSPIATTQQLLDAKNPTHFFSAIRSLDRSLGKSHDYEYETLRHKLCGENECNCTTAHNCPSTNKMRKHKLIRTTNIKVDELNNPLCPWCADKGRNSYLFTTPYATYEGDTGTSFKCNQQECCFVYNLIHEGPWEEMLVDVDD